MEERKFCAKCKAPMVKGASFCVVCGSGEVVSSLDEEIKPSSTAVTAPVPAPVQERTVSYKSYAEYEKEIDSKQRNNVAMNMEPKKKSGGAVKVLKKIGYAFLCILLSVALLFGGFALGVYLTYEGMLDEYLPEAEVDKAAVARVEEAEECYDIQQELAAIVATYVSENSIYIEKTTIITIEAPKEGELPVISVQGEALTSAECCSMFSDEHICPSEGTYNIQVIPYVDANEQSMFKVEVKCDGGEEGFEHFN